MTGQTKWWMGRGALLVAAVFAVSGTAQAQAPTFDRRSNEIRFQLDFQVPAAALAALLPPGFTSDVAAAGPAKDCNVRVIFIDEVAINGPDNRPMGRGTNQLVYLTAPVKDASGASAQLVVGGLTADPSAAPGPYGNYLAATTHTMARHMAAPASGAGPVMETQDWVFRTASGEHLEMHIEFQRGGANYRPEYERVFYSAKNATMVRVSHEQLVLDILRNTTTNPPDHVTAFSFSGGGGSYARLFDGTEKVLSWDSILWMTRTEGGR